MKINTLADCFKIVSDTLNEVDSLHLLISEKFQKEIKDKLNMLLSAGESSGAYELKDNSDRIIYSTAQSIPLKGRGKGQKVARYISWQIALSGQYINYPSNKEPLIHVCLWATHCKDDWIEFPLDYASDPFNLSKGGKLIQWDCEGASQDWLKKSWTFAVRLTSINSVSDIEKYIVNPAIALLNGESVDVALPDTDSFGDVLFRFSREQLTSAE